MPSRDMMRASARGFQKYYNPKIGGEVRMDTNTNVLGPNPAAMEYMKNWRGDISGYPNTYSDGLRGALAELYGLQTDNFVAGNGSDEMLDVAFKTFAEVGSDCVMPVPSYSLYDYFITMNGGATIPVELDEDFQLNVDDMVRTDAKVIIMPSPNNPTGNIFRHKDVEEVLNRFDGIVILDEAYVEYASGSMISKVDEFENLIVMRTFSKAYSMAGLRVGYAVSNIAVADMMNCVKIPYSLNMLSEGAAIAAVKDQGFIKRSVAMVNEQRPKLDSALRGLGFRTFPSDSNFILAECPIDHADMVKGLKEKGVLIRDFGSKHRTENCVRMTIGTAELNEMMIDKMAQVISECR
jgi:histidinol-phosphate aminotransferase